MVQELLSAKIRRWQLEGWVSLESGIHLGPLESYELMQSHHFKSLGNLDVGIVPDVTMPHGNDNFCFGRVRGLAG